MADITTHLEISSGGVNTDFLIEDELLSIGNTLVLTKSTQDREDLSHEYRDISNGEPATLTTQYGVQDYFLVPRRGMIIPRDNFKVLSKWRGEVTEVESTFFRANLFDEEIADKVKQAEIFIDEISVEDRPLIETGAIFYWTIGFWDKPSGRTRSSIILFRRTLEWLEDEIDALKNQEDGFDFIVDDS